MSDDHETKRLLIEQMGSQDGQVAFVAMIELSKRGWIMDGSLRGANLQYADLCEAMLDGADLTGADLSHASIGPAFLEGINLQRAILVETDLRNAILYRANLEGANLKGALLQETSLEGATLKNANLEGAKFDERTVLPDRTHWTEDSDLQRFTDPNHPNFWVPPS